MKLLMIGHLLGDFYFQATEMEDNENDVLFYTIRHCFIYSIIMYVVLAITTGKFLQYILPVYLIGMLHLLVDRIKSALCKSKKFDKWELGVFLITQLIHIVTIFIVSRFYVIEFNLSWIRLSKSLECKILDELTAINAFLLCGKPAAIIVSKVFTLISETINVADSNEDKAPKSKIEENVKVNAWTGILEREIILILGILGEYGAIGFIVAAKSLARHRCFDDNQAFAERYLIGTLLSALIALLCIAMYSIW